jgi:DNA end-binding protein Ku
MPPRSMWNGEISWSLLTLGVKLYPATEEKDVAFKNVHVKDAGLVKFRRFCQACDEEVPWSEVGKGFEQPNGEIVAFTEEELDKLPVPALKRITVEEFVPANQIDPLWYHSFYYIGLASDSGGRAYALLRAALQSGRRVAVGRVALRSRERLVTISARGDVLLLTRLKWPDEIREPVVDLPSDKPSAAERKLALQLVDMASGDFDPAKFADGYREALLALVEGKTIVAPEVAPKQKVETMMEALQASLQAQEKAQQKARRPRKKQEEKVGA